MENTARYTYEVTYTRGKTTHVDNISCDMLGNQGSYISFVTNQEGYNPPRVERILSDVSDVRLIEDRGPQEQISEDENSGGDVTSLPFRVVDNKDLN